MSMSNTIHSQLKAKLPIPTADFSGKTIIVTGSNGGIGKEAVKHFARLNASRVIIAVRSTVKGDSAKVEIEKESKGTGVLEVWELDYCKYASVKAFAAKVRTLDRLDVVVLNAGITTQKYEVVEDNESCITVNVISTTLLALLILPVLRDFAERFSTVPAIVVVGSDTHAFTKFPEWKTPNSLATLNNEKTANMFDRYVFDLQTVSHAINYCPGSYQVSKLLQLFAVREIAATTANKKPFVVVNTVNPGLCETDLIRNLTGGVLFAMKMMRALLARTAEEGSRNLVHASIAGPESNGVYLENCKIQK